MKPTSNHAPCVHEQPRFAVAAQIAPTRARSARREHFAAAESARVQQVIADGAARASLDARQHKLRDREQ